MSKSLRNEIKKVAEGLKYISETEAEIEPFFGSKTERIDEQILLSKIGRKSDELIAEGDFELFFKHPTKMQEWFDEDRRETTKKFQKLKKLLEKNLTDVKVFKVGNLRIDIYIVGIDDEKNLVGVKTSALET